MNQDNDLKDLSVNNDFVVDHRLLRDLNSSTKKSKANLKLKSNSKIKNKEKNLSSKRKRNEIEGKNERRIIFRKIKKKSEIDETSTRILGNNNSVSLRSFDQKSVSSEILNDLFNDAKIKEKSFLSKMIDLDVRKNVKFAENSDKTISNSHLVKIIKFSFDKARKGNICFAIKQENLNLFELNKEKIEEDDKIKCDDEFVTPNKVNFYEEHKKRFYMDTLAFNQILNKNSKIEENSETQNLKIQESPFKKVKIENKNSHFMPNDVYSVFRNLSKTLVIVGFFGTLIIYLKNPILNHNLANLIDIFNDSTKALVLVGAILLISYYMYSKNEEDCRNNEIELAKMIYDYMKLVLESEKKNNILASICENDIINYFSFDLKLKEDFLVEKIIPLISNFVKNEKLIKEIVDVETRKLSWKLIIEEEII